MNLSNFTLAVILVTCSTLKLVLAAECTCPPGKCICCHNCSSCSTPALAYCKADRPPYYCLKKVIDKQNVQRDCLNGFYGPYAPNGATEFTAIERTLDAATSGNGKLVKARWHICSTDKCNAASGSRYIGAKKIRRKSAFVAFGFSLVPLIMRRVLKLTNEVEVTTTTATVLLAMAAHGYSADHEEDVSHLRIVPTKRTSNFVPSLDDRE